jgi:hypothetical protein
MNLYSKGVALERQLSRRILPPPKKLVAGNSKTVQSFRSLLLFCSERTPICTRFCYACKGPISWANCVAKAIAVRRWIEENGVEKAAQRLSYEVRCGDFRWMDRGDFDPLTIQLANRLVELRPDVTYNAFSRQLSALKALSPKIARTFSVDHCSKGRIQDVPPDIRIAYLKIETGEKIPKRVNVVFPANHRKELLGDKRDCGYYKNHLLTCSTCRRCL